MYRPQTEYKRLNVCVLCVIDDSSTCVLKQINSKQLVREEKGGKSSVVAYLQMTGKQ